MEISKWNGSSQNLTTAWAQCKGWTLPRRLIITPVWSVTAQRLKCWLELGTTNKWVCAWVAFLKGARLKKKQQNRNTSGKAFLAQKSSNVRWKCLNVNFYPGFDSTFIQNLDTMCKNQSGFWQTKPTAAVYENRKLPRSKLHNSLSALHGSTFYCVVISTWAVSKIMHCRFAFTESDSTFFLTSSSSTTTTFFLTANCKRMLKTVDHT